MKPQLLPPPEECVFQEEPLLLPPPPELPVKFQPPPLPLDQAPRMDWKIWEMK